MNDQKQKDDRLRLTRLARGLSQGDLAQTAGVTRQAISGIESGRWSPSLDVALALAKVLDSTVEGLFGFPVETEPVTGRLAVAADGDDQGLSSRRMLLAEVAGDTVAFPLVGDHTMVTGFVPALATGPGGADQVETAGVPAAKPGPKAAGRRRSPLSAQSSRPEAKTQAVAARRLAAQTPTLAIAGCDPALALLLGPLQRHDPPVNLAWWSTCNARARAMLEDGAVHVAALHRKIEARAKERSGIEMVGFASWREGLAVAPRFNGKIRDVTDAVERGLRFANRDLGSEARRLLDQELGHYGIDSADVVGYESESTSHLLAASAIASGLVDAAVVSEPAALAYGLDFVPWQIEISELHIPRSLLSSVEVKALLDVLAGRELPDQLAALEGYDADPCGRILAA